MVVDDVEQHLDASRVQLTHHLAELLHLLAAAPASGVLAVGCEESDRVVAPVVAQAPLDEAVVVHELVHRQQLDRRDPEPLQVLDERRVGEPGVGAAQLGRHVGMLAGGPLDVDLVDDGVLPRRAQLAVAVPVEEGVDDHAAGHERRRVAVVAHVGFVPAVAEDGLVPDDLAGDRLGVGVEEQLGRVAAQARLGSHGPCTR